MGELTRGNVIAALSGLALIVIMFLSWFEAGGGSTTAIIVGLDTTENAWQAFQFTDWILFLTAVAAIGAAVLSARGTSSQAPLRPEALAFALGALSTLLVLFRILNPVADAERKLGLFLGFLASAGIAAGSLMAMREGVAEPRTRRRPPPRRAL
jgi:hypothetical protein